MSFTRTGLDYRFSVLILTFFKCAWLRNVQGEEARPPPDRAPILLPQAEGDVTGKRITMSLLPN